MTFFGHTPVDASLELIGLRLQEKILGVLSPIGGDLAILGGLIVLVGLFYSTYRSITEGDLRRIFLYIVGAMVILALFRSTSKVEVKPLSGIISQVETYSSEWVGTGDVVESNSLFTLGAGAIDEGFDKTVSILDSTLGNYMVTTPMAFRRLSELQATAEIDDQALKEDIRIYFADCSKGEIYDRHLRKCDDLAEAILKAPITGYSYDGLEKWAETQSNNVKDELKKFGDTQFTQLVTNYEFALMVSALRKELAQGLPAEGESLSAITGTAEDFLHKIIGFVSGPAAFSYIQGGVCLVIFSLFPVFLLLALFPGGLVRLAAYFGAIFWVKSWSLLYFFINQLDRLMGIIGFEGFGGSAFFSPSTSILDAVANNPSGIAEIAHFEMMGDIAAYVGGFLIVTIPVVAYFVFFVGLYGLLRTTITPARASK